MFNCQVFYHKEGTNHWRATIAFFPKEKMKVKITLGSNAVCRLCILFKMFMQKVNELYQDANNWECVDVHFKSSKINLTTGKSVGWKCEISPDHHTVKLICM